MGKSNSLNNIQSVSYFDLYVLKHEVEYEGDKMLRVLVKTEFCINRQCYRVTRFMFKTLAFLVGLQPTVIASRAPHLLLEQSPSSPVNGFSRACRSVQKQLG